MGSGIRHILIDRHPASADNVGQAGFSLRHDMQPAGADCRTSTCLGLGISGNNGKTGDSRYAYCLDV
ncbi:hypothetical protein GCM10011400_62930 [Paraburkholderia caffeinilytica]|uniref:Uncharacterized protein n=1 Tax=Paraburkholderia caffeinilytica TaxID=1761016 RepID=A0ABQ1NAX9_9BURK|nr:hypothetical protein GCM10011400_62930 [Paraburkholderia caffeinilytica]